MQGKNLGRKFTDLTKDEVKFIVKEIFNPEKFGLGELGVASNRNRK